MTILSNGNVGIGNNAPDSKLSVANNIQIKAIGNDILDFGMATFIRTASTNGINTRDYMLSTSIVIRIMVIFFLLRSVNLPLS